MLAKKIIKSLVLEEYKFIQEKLKGKFNLTKFKELSTSAARNPDIYARITLLNLYAKKHLGEPIGEGSSRNVWALSGNKALKIANDYKPEAGIEQNKQEVDLSTNPKTKDGVAHVLDYDPEYKWIIMELVKPIRFETAVEYLGIDSPSFEQFLSLVLAGKKPASPQLLKTILTGKLNMAKDDLVYHEKRNDVRGIKYTKIEIENYEKMLQQLNGPKIGRLITTLNALLALKQELGLHTDDLIRTEHFGLTSDGRIVALDYGFSQEIYDKYYRP